jgi:hypothetical protein
MRRKGLKLSGAGSGSHVGNSIWRQIYHHLGESCFLNLTAI